MGLRDKAGRAKHGGNGAGGERRRGLLARSAALRAGGAPARGLRARAASALEKKNGSSPDLPLSVSGAAPGAAAAAAAVSAGETQDALELRTLDLANLLELGKEINGTLDPDALATVLLFACMGHVGTARACLLRRDARGDLVLAARRGYPDDAPAPAPLSAGGGAFHGLAAADAPRAAREFPDTDALSGLELVVPLKAKGELVGALGLGPRFGDEAYTPGQLGFLGTLAAMAAVAIENARLYRSLEQKLGQLSALYEISRVINGTGELHEVLALACETLATGFGLEKAGFFLLGDGGYRLARGIGLGPVAPVPEDDPVFAAAAAAGEPLDVPDFAARPEQAARFAPADLAAFTGALLVPLAAAGRTVGLLAVFAARGREPGAWDRAERELFAIIASQLAPPILTAAVVELERRKVQDPFTPFAALLAREYAQADAFGLSLAVADFTVGGLDQLVVGGSVPDALALLARAGAALRGALPDKYRVVRTGPDAWTALLPGVSLRERDELLAAGARALGDALAAEGLGDDAVVQATALQVPEDCKDPQTYLFRQR